MKTIPIKKPTMYAIPLIIFTLLMIYGTNVSAYRVQKDSTHGVKATNSVSYVTLAKGQAYVPPKKSRDGIEC